MKTNENGFIETSFKLPSINLIKLIQTNRNFYFNYNDNENENEDDNEDNYLNNTFDIFVIGSTNNEFGVCDKKIKFKLPFFVRVFAPKFLSISEQSSIKIQIENGDENLNAIIALRSLSSDLILFDDNSHIGLFLLLTYF